MKNLPVRQPLKKITLKLTLPKNFRHLVTDELNVKNIEENKNLETDVALDTDVTPELKDEGNYRELVRALQDLRKKVGLTPSDTIALTVQADAMGEELLKKFETDLKKTVLVSKLRFAPNDGAEIRVNDLAFRVMVEKRA